MADSNGGGNKKILGLTPTGLLLAGGGALAVFFGYRYLKSRQTSTTTGASTPLGVGTTVPFAITSTTAAETAAPTTYSAWVDKVLKTIQTYVHTPAFGSATAFNAINAWQSGQCISTGGYKFLTSVFTQLGLPPDAIDYPLTVCKTATTTTTTTTTTKTTTGTTKTKTTLGTILKGIIGNRSGKSTAPTASSSATPVQVAVATFASGTYFVLGGFLSTGRYTGWNTTSPVYFTWTGNGTPTQGSPPAGAKGVVAYTNGSLSSIGHHSSTTPSWSKGYT